MFDGNLKSNDYLLYSQSGNKLQNKYLYLPWYFDTNFDPLFKRFLGFRKPTIQHFSSEPRLHGDIFLSLLQENGIPQGEIRLRYRKTASRPHAQNLKFSKGFPGENSHDTLEAPIIRRTVDSKGKWITISSEKCMSKTEHTLYSCKLNRVSQRYSLCQKTFYVDCCLIKYQQGVTHCFIPSLKLTP